MNPAACCLGGLLVVVRPNVECHVRPRRSIGLFADGAVLALDTVLHFYHSYSSTVARLF